MSSHERCRHRSGEPGRNATGWANTVRRTWIMRTDTTEVALDAGEAAVVRGGELSGDVDADGDGVQAFLRARGGTLCVAAAPGALLVDGRAPVGSVAVLRGRDHLVRVRETEIRVTCHAGRVVRHSGPDDARCALSGEGIALGHRVCQCACGVNVLMRFLTTYGDGKSCPRCGERIID